MTETMARKPKFTRRGVILGSAALVLVLAVALVVFGGNTTGSVRTTLMGFEKSADKSSFLAVFHLTNETAMDFVLLDADVSGTVLGRFHSRTGDNEAMLGRLVDAGFTDNSLNPHSARVARVPLPNDGSKGRVEVCLGRISRIIQPQTGPLARLRMWWRSNVLLTKKIPQTLCDQEIQCPIVLPDGTLQPPRLLSGPERKR